MKQKILFISKLPPPYYGTTVWTQILLSSNLGKSFRIIHFNNNIHKNFDTLGKPNIVNALKNILLYFKFVVTLIKNLPDLVFIPISQTTAGFVKDSGYVIISRVFRRKTLLILHGSDIRNWMRRSSKIVQIYTGYILKSTQGVIVLGENLKVLFKDFYPDNKIFVVPNGGNYTFPPREENNTTRLLFLANLIPSKGIIDVLESLNYLERYHQKLILNVAGEWFDSEFKELCYKVVKNTKIPVNFHGQVNGDKKYQLLSNSDIFIFPPKEPEGHPYVIVEAMAAGLPIISTDKGAITESVKEGINGFIIEPGKPVQIAEKIAFLLEHPDIRLAMAGESRRLYEENFTEEKMVNKLHDIFNAVLIS